MFKRPNLTVTPLLVRFMRDENGATAIEYAMIASGIGIAIAATLVNLGSAVNGLYGSVLTSLK
ncbi:MAG: Flp family type IVb pilin [Xanthobacteraceae bacterium]|jgi:pilus assembly protein Flp/PilA